MRLLDTVLSLLSLGLLSGCTAEAPHVKAAETASNAAPKNYPARFQLVSGPAFGLALDTKTGILCHTYEMVDTTKHIPLCAELLVNEKQIVTKLTMDPESKKPFDWEKYPVAN